MNTIMIVSTTSNTSLEDIANNTKATLWFQLYVFENQSQTESLILRAEKAGYKALVITVDTPFKGDRRRDIRNGFDLGSECKFPLFQDNKISTAFNWDDIAKIKSMTHLPIIIKGITHPDDAKAALEQGVAGIVISNHGGRQLEGEIGTLDALPEIAAVIQRRMPIFIDGGFRSGSDCFKALAMGAAGILLGRPILYALAANKVTELLDYFQKDLARTMRIMGCPTIAEINRQALSLVIDNRVAPSIRLERLSLIEKISELERKNSLLEEENKKLRHAYKLKLFDGSSSSIGKADEAEAQVVHIDGSPYAAQRNTGVG